MKHAIAALAALALAGCGGPETKEEAMSQAADFFNNNGEALAGAGLKDVKLTAAVEGDVLVMKMTNFPSGTRTFDENAARKLFRAKLCEMRKSREILELGGKIRVDIRSNYGKELPSVQVARC